MTKAEKQIWLEMRTRFKSALEKKQEIRKQDLIIAHKLHLSVFGKPKYRPTINCCIDFDTWHLIIKNLNKDYIKKNDNSR